MSGRGPRGRARNRTETAEAPNSTPSTEAESGPNRGLPTQEAPKAPAPIPKQSINRNWIETEIETGRNRGLPSQEATEAQPVADGGSQTGQTDTSPIKISSNTNPELVDPLSRLSLHSEQQEQRKPRQIELVPITRPVTCKIKTGEKTFNFTKTSFKKIIII